MKNLITIILIFVSSLIYSQNNLATDSVNLRIFNDGKFYIKEFKITISGNEYVFKDIWKKKYSDFIKVPYIWPSNKTETTVVVKRMIKYDEWYNTLMFPVDHVGEKKIETGFYTLELETRLKNKNLTVELNLMKMNDKRVTTQE